MQNRTLTGSRIRERRLTQGIKQAELARMAGISAAYLNLIEHNKRRIGGKLLSDLATTLQIDASRLAEGAQSELLAELSEVETATQADSANRATPPERIEDFATRFPGWAGVAVTQQRRIRDLERRIDALNDRIAHDPDLAASLHDVLSTATAIASASAILAETKEIEAEWRDRFHRNIHEDSQRLAQSSQSLVSYLETTEKADATHLSPAAEFDAWLADCDHHILAFERKADVDDVDVFASGLGLASPDARAIAAHHFKRYRSEVAKMPLSDFQDAAQMCGHDPATLAVQFDTSLSSVLRRLASLPRDAAKGRIGLAICDNAGALGTTKPVGGFSMTRATNGCPTWPLYQALSRPQVPIRRVVETADRDATRYLAYAIAEPIGPVGFDAPPIYEATMVLLPRDLVALPDIAPLRVGTNCRLFPCASCRARGAVGLFAAR